MNQQHCTAVGKTIQACAGVTDVTLEPDAEQLQLLQLVCISEPTSVTGGQS